MPRSFDVDPLPNTVTFMVRCSSDAFRNHFGADTVEAAVEVAFEGDKIKYWNNTFNPETLEKFWTALG
jgi:hypothetical protein